MSLVALLLVSATAASAQQVYTLHEGYWARSEGRDADVPFVGVTPNNCEHLTFGFRADAITMLMYPGPLSSMQMGFVAQGYGCPSAGAGTVTMLTTTSVNATSMGAGGAFTLPTNIFRRPLPGTIVAVPIPENMQVIQGATSASWRIPNSTRGTGNGALGAMTAQGATVGPVFRTPPGCVEATCMNLAPFRRFHRSHWMGGPNTTYVSKPSGRVGPSFTFCNGFGNCGTGMNSGSFTQATDGRLIKYVAGPNGFGGTSNQVVGNGVFGSLALFDLSGNVVFNVLDSFNTQYQVEGRGYADFKTDYLPAATKAYTMAMIAPVMSPAGFGSMTTLTLITMVTGPTSPMFPFATAQTNQKYGFPLTTGTVVVRRTSPLQGDVNTFTAMGYDSVTSMGARNINLVAGAIGNLAGTPLDINIVGIQQIFLALPEPGRTGQLVAGAAALLGIAAWRARRSRA